MYGKKRKKHSESETLSIETENLLILYKGRKKDRTDRMKKICRNVYDLALLPQGKLEGDELTAFIHRSEELLESYSTL